MELATLCSEGKHRHERIAGRIAEESAMEEMGGMGTATCHPISHAVPGWVGPSWNRANIFVDWIWPGALGCWPLDTQFTQNSRWIATCEGKGTVLPCLMVNRGGIDMRGVFVWTFFPEFHQYPVGCHLTHAQIQNLLVMELNGERRKWMNFVLHG